MDSASSGRAMQGRPTIISPVDIKFEKMNNNESSLGRCDTVLLRIGMDQAFSKKILKSDMIHSF